MKESEILSFGVSYFKDKFSLEYNDLEKSGKLFIDNLVVNKLNVFIIFQLNDIINENIFFSRKILLSFGKKENHFSLYNIYLKTENS